MTTQLDVLIIGAGLVGNSLALAIAKHAKTAIIEKNSAEKVDSFTDNRALALSFSSQLILSTLGIHLKENPIKQVHVSDAGHFGATRFNAQDYGIDALGYVMPAQVLTHTLQQKILQNSLIQKFYSTTVQKISAFPEGYRVEVKMPDGEIKTLTTKLLIGADGIHSPTRKLLEIAEKYEEHAQTALTARITLTRSHENIAYERFYELGVLATLPTTEKEIGIVWTTSNTLANKLTSLSDADFCQEFQTAFGYRLGKFASLEKRHAYPLRSLQALEQIRPHAVLLGNAAHTLHPVAAQGFNLSLRDVAVLAQIIMDAMAAGKNPGDFAVLEKYLQARKKAQIAIAGFTQTIVRVFSQHTLPYTLLQTVGFLGLEILPLAKNTFAKHAMGIAENMPKWVSLPS